MNESDEIFRRLSRPNFDELETIIRDEILDWMTYNYYTFPTCRDRYDEFLKNYGWTYQEYIKHLS